MEHALLLDLEETYLIDLLSTHPRVVTTSLLKLIQGQGLLGDTTFEVVLLTGDAFMGKGVSGSST